MYILKHYILDPIRKIAGDFKDIDISLFKTNTFKQMCMGEKKLSKPKTQKQSKENKKIKSVRNLLILKKGKNRLIKDRIILTLFEKEEEK